MWRGKKDVRGKKGHEKQHGPEAVPSSQVQLPSCNSGTHRLQYFSYATYCLSSKPTLGPSLPFLRLWTADLHNLQHPSLLHFLGLASAVAGSARMGGERGQGISSLFFPRFGGILTITYNQAPAGSPSLLQLQQNFQPREGHGSFKSGHTLGLPCGLLVKTLFPLQGV